MNIPSFYKEIIWYVLIPLFVILIIFGFFLFKQGHRQNQLDTKQKLQTRYQLNFWSALIGIFFGSILLSVSIGFSVSFLETLFQNNMSGTYPIIVAILAIFPLAPLGFLIYFIISFMKTIKRGKLGVDIKKKGESNHE